MRKVSTCFVVVWIGWSVVGCGDDVVNSDAATVADADANDAGSADVTGMTDTGMIDTGTTDTGTTDSGPARGCVDDPTICTGEQMCCSGVPYPEEGICQNDCPGDSDRDVKQGFEQVDADALLDRLAALPVSEWSYKVQPGVRHMGPMAQDFRAAFGLGTSDRTIHPTDANGVTIAALQALYRRVQRLEDENRRLRRPAR